MGVASQSQTRSLANSGAVARIHLPNLGVKRVLLLQGPNGPFFARFAEDLRGAGIHVSKINLHAGESLYYRRDVVSYRGTFEAWPTFVRKILEDRKIDGVFVFGDGRPYHRAAIQEANALSIPVFVFEEGYLRPNHITLEREGVNGYSRMPRDPNFYYRFTESPIPNADSVLPAFGIGAWAATFYAIAATFLWFLYPHYRHHRSINAFAQAYYWVLGGSRKLWYARTEKGVIERVIRDHDGRYFVLTLQVHCDFQIQHSPYKDVETFIEESVASFAEHAPKDTVLVVKHHPMDRGYRSYKRLLHTLAVKHGIEGRITYVHDVHLPTLLRHSAGTVMINSTVGLQAASYGTPVKVLGTAVYDMPGLTSQVPLAQFWTSPGTVDEALYLGFRNYLLRENQVNGSFFRRLVQRKRGAGLLFPETWGELTAKS